MVAYIDGHKDEFGIEPICTVLQVAPSTYYAARARLPSPRALRDAVLLPLILSLWVANYRVYGVHKMWKTLVRAGETVGRDQVARLMRQLGIQGVRRGDKVRTTRPDGQADRHPDLALLRALQQDLAPSFVRVIFVHLSAVLSAAVDDEKIIKNPCKASSIKVPRLNPQKIEPWSIEQVHAVRDALPERYRICATLAGAPACAMGNCSVSRWKTLISFDTRSTCGDS